MNGYEQELARAQTAVNNALDGAFREPASYSRLQEAMRYSLLAGGKRVRPVFLLKFCEYAGGDPAAAMSAACGIEMLHTYSLIHDDLPCMDNDDLRRGKPTCHKAFGETTAVLAGDALQAAAFSFVLRADVSATAKAAMAATLADAAGVHGMCGGQYLDTENEGNEISEEDLYRIHALKTGALLKAACVMGVQCAEGSQKMLHAAEEYADNLGMAFQILDDLLDCTSTQEELGKPIGSDAEEGKATFATLFGEKGCRDLIQRYTEMAKDAVRDAFPEPGFLLWMADKLSCRRK